MIDSTCITRYRIQTESPANLRVTFPSGKTYGYLDVPAHVLSTFIWAPSLGKAYNTYIKGHYPCTLLARIDERVHDLACERIRAEFRNTQRQVA